MALVGIDEFKTWLGITSTSEDAQLQMFLDGASAAVTEYTGMDFTTRTYPTASDDGSGDNGIYCGNWHDRIILRQGPVTSVTSVHLDGSANFATNPSGAFATATLLVEGTDYVVEWDGCLPGTSTKCCRSRFLRKIGGVWPGITAFTAGAVIGQAGMARGNIKVVYTAGYSTLPISIKTAILQLATAVRHDSDKGNQVQSESLGGYSYSLLSGAAGKWPELGSTRQLLAKWGPEIAI